MISIALNLLQQHISIKTHGSQSNCNGHEVKENTIVQCDCLIGSNKTEIYFLAETHVAI